MASSCNPSVSRAIPFMSYEIQGLTIYAAIISDLTPAQYTVQIVQQTDENPRELGSQTVSVVVDSAVPLRWRRVSN
jgi:hypothetical protein